MKYVMYLYIYDDSTINIHVNSSSFEMMVHTPRYNKGKKRKYINYYTSKHRYIYYNYIIYTLFIHPFSYIVFRSFSPGFRSPL